MKNCFRAAGWLVISLIIAVSAGCVQPTEVPTLKGPVNDHAEVIDAEAETSLTSKLLAYEKETSNQVVILTIASLGGDTIEGFAQKVFIKWKLGQEGKDNGVLILLAKEDRAMRIEVGRGLEGSLTDAIAGRIVDDGMAPEFKEDRFSNGFERAINAIQRAIKGEFNADGGNVNFPGVAAAPGMSTGWRIFWVIVAIIILVLILIWMESEGLLPHSSGGSSSSYSGSWGGGGGGGYSGGGGFSGGGGASGGF